MLNVDIDLRKAAAFRSVVDETDIVNMTSDSLTVRLQLNKNCLENQALSPCSPAVLDVDTLYLFMPYLQFFPGYCDHFTLKNNFIKAVHLPQTRISKHNNYTVSQLHWIFEHRDLLNMPCV